MRFHVSVIDSVEFNFGMGYMRKYLENDYPILISVLDLHTIPRTISKKRFLAPKKNEELHSNAAGRGDFGGSRRATGIPIHSGGLHHLLQRVELP